MEGIYKVNMLPNDLCTEETIYQIADTLDNLNNIVDDVFSRLFSRIENNLDRTKSLQQRIDTSKEKVEQLSTIQNAIKVFSCAKYPSNIKYEHYESFLDFDCYKFEPKKHILSNKSQKPPNERDLQEKLHFYHVKVGKPEHDSKKPKLTLQNALEKISSVGDLLIFNTDESPYIQAPSKITSYAEQLRTNRVKSESVLDAAPSSITDRGQILKSDVDEYLYTPGMGDVPELEMPLDLPHLPGIAGDLQFIMAGDRAIAPSVVTSPTTMESLPEVEAEELPDLKLEEAVTLPDIPDAVDMTTPAVVSVYVPPPPPPPPPPPLDLEVTRKITSDNSSPNPIPAPSSGDAHFNLMAAIRSAGGAGKAKLKSTATSTPEKPSKVPATGDLMADLHAKLSMRRRGISGAERGDSMLHTLAKVIPEPGGDQSSVTNSSEDEDWE